MTKHQTILRCSQTTATVVFILVGCLFIVTGCRSLYEKIGMSPDQVNAQVAADQQAIGQILDQSRTSTSQIITSAIAGLGAIASGILAKWLGTERKINKVLITGIEKSAPTTVKESVYKKSVEAGVSSKLARRVASLT